MSHREAGSVARFKIVSTWLSAIYQGSHAEFLGTGGHFAQKPNQKK